MTLNVRELLADNPNLACSGGAIGSDTAWGTAALDAGHNVLHFGFAGHHSAAGGIHVTLSPHQLAAAHEFVRGANETLHRQYPARSTFTNNLLRRNWYQIRNSKRLYAVAPLELDARTVKGGTGWAVQMWLDRIGVRTTSRTWVWCTATKHWHRWNGRVFEPCDPPPAPAGVYAAIGTRYPDEHDISAIRDIYGIAAA